MGYVKHHAIVVTSWDDEKIKAAHKTAIDIFGNQVSSIVNSKINSCFSFFVGPDGSKDGWVESEHGDDCRKNFIKWINEQAYEDGSNSIDYAELFYGEDNGNAEILNHN